MPTTQRELPAQPESRLELAKEALEIAKACDAAGDKVGWLAAVTIAAQLVQLERLFQEGPA